MLGRRGVLAGVAAATAMTARAQTAWPDRPLRWIVGYPPGGASDAFARLIAAQMGPRLGQTVVVENRPGGGAVLASDAVVRSPADGNTWLHVYAADLARAPNGEWWVVGDRTQAPSGAGYALENRQIISRAFPELFRELGIQPLEGFFSSLQSALQNLAPAAGGTPLSVLLTPGRFNETYFEHVYLARQLGVPLVEGQDLTVRDATVYMKTLSGLQRVHTILRRMDDDYCDPLELRSDSALGVPGLLEAARAGRVAIANALGSGVVESPGLLGFLPRMTGTGRIS